MAWIRTIDEGEATDELKAVYDTSRKLYGFVPNIRRALSLNPMALRAAGLTDEQILAVVLVAGFFNLATRIADALGVELDPQLTRGTPEYKKFFRTQMGD